MTATISMGGEGYYILDEIELPAGADKGIRFVNTDPDGEIKVKLGSTDAASGFKVTNSDDTALFDVKADGKVTIPADITCSKLQVAGKSFVSTIIAENNTASSVVYTAAQMIGRIIKRNPSGAPRIDTTDSAVNILSEIGSAAVGSSFTFQIKNMSTTSGEVITVMGGNNVTTEGTMTIGQNSARSFTVVVTNIGSGTEAVILQSQGGLPDEASPSYTYTSDHSVVLGVNGTLNHNLTDETMFPMYRAANGTGASDAWSLAMWLRKDGNDGDNWQHICTIGENDTNLLFTNATIFLMYRKGSGNKYIKYRISNFLYEINGYTPANSIPNSTWMHVMLTYGGGETGIDVANLASYYAQYKIFINGVEQTLTNSNSQNGIAAKVSAKYIKFGRPLVGTTDWRGNLDHIAIFNSDQSTNITSIYNGGLTHDLGELADPPVHYWLCEDEGSVVTDVIGDIDLTNNNCTFSTSRPPDS